MSILNTLVVHDLNSVENTKKFLCSKFDMKDMGEVDVILGIKIDQHSEGIILSQSHYIEKVLKRFNMFGGNDVSTLFDPNVKLAKNKGDSVSQLDYFRAIGCLMYIMNCTRPDITYAVSKLSRYTSNPNSEHWMVVIRVFKYLMRTIDYGLHYERYPTVLEEYCDAN